MKNPKNKNMHFLPFEPCPNPPKKAVELVCGADFWCNRHCRTSPVVLEGFWGQVWPKIGRKPETSEFRIANEPLRRPPPFLMGFPETGGRFDLERRRIRASIFRHHPAQHHCTGTRNQIVKNAFFVLVVFTFN